MSSGASTNMMDPLMDNNYNIFSRSNDSTMTINQTNFSNQSVIPLPDHTPDTKIPFIVVYCILFVIAAGGNLSVVITLFRSKRHRRSRVSLMICHLAVADLMVAFIMIPLEIGWRITVSWEAGNVACKVFLFLRAFCLYLSSNVLVCVSLDRCFAVIYPLRVSAARKRGKVMLVMAWIIALIYSIPQSIVFHLKQHPSQPNFLQCVTFGSFRTPIWEKAYNLFCVIVMYFLPLMIISGAYSVIMCEISNRSKEKETKHTTSLPGSGIMRLRCNDTTHIERARQRTLRLTITIVAVFIWCWTPYVVMTLWYVFDRDSAEKVDNTIQDSLFIMAVSNSCMNPLVYGSYAMKCRCPCLKSNKSSPTAPAKMKLQRKSTDAGIAHSDRLTAQNRDDVKSQTFQPNEIVKFSFLVPNGNGTATMTQTTRLNCTRLETKDIRAANYRHNLLPCPSLAEIAIIEPISRPSFYSDPVHQHNECSEFDMGVTRSLDTGVWR